MAWIKLLNPEVFQGNLERRHYFEEWRLKHVSKDKSRISVLIPGVSLADDTAFIQAINGVSGEVVEFVYPLSEFRWNDQSFSISIADNVFCNEYSRVNLKNEKLSIQGELKYSNMIKYPRSLTSPGIMGWYSFIPLLECYHGVVSVSHEIQGKLKINKEQVDFSGGKGIIEKDWGKSFPRSWIRTQCNHFTNEQTSLLLSIARVPWMTQSINGVLGYLYLNGEFHTFANYNNTSVVKAGLDKNTLTFELNNEKYTLRVKAVRKKTTERKVAQDGSMNRVTSTSMDSTLSFELEDKQGNITKDKGEMAGLEIEEEIFQYL